MVVIDAALAIVGEVGIDALTIRALADRVGAPAMSLYTHFARKDDLLDLMCAELARRLYADSGCATWQAEIQSLCNHVRQALIEHPGWTQLLLRPAPLVEVQLHERVVALMTGEGISREDALGALSRAALLALGWTFVELAFRDSKGDFRRPARFDRLKTWTEGQSLGCEQPVTPAAFAGLGLVDPNESFEHAISTFVAGLDPIRR